jgi:hypothetical protein
VVGYDEQGNNIFDMGLMQKKTIESADQRQQRELEMFV